MTCCGRLFHTRDAATRNDRSPTVARRVRRTASIDDEAERSLYRARESAGRLSSSFPWIEMTKVEFLRQMAFRRKISHWNIKYDFLLVLHYKHWCILLINKVLGYFRTFSFWLVFPNWARFRGFWPLIFNFNTSDTQKAHPYAKKILLSHNTSKSVANCGL